MRNKQREQDPILRGKNFEEVSLGFDSETALKEANRCIQCKKPSCVKGCPVEVNIPKFILDMREGRMDEAVRAIKNTNMLPAVCGRVCPQETQCEASCILARKGEPVAIGALERIVGDYAIKNKTDAKINKIASGKVAIVGSGPAGLSCAADCASAGLDVTIYESLHEAGGVLMYGIPEFRLPVNIVKSEIESLKRMGVKLELNVVIGKTLTIKELESEYDAIFLGYGAGLPIFLGIPGENLPGVYSANEYLTRVNLMGAYKKESATPLVKGRKVAVIGAGNVAMDSARTALRMGADKVTIVYRRSREEMPAREEEIHHAEEEGIEFKLLSNPIEIIGENYVTGIRAHKMELGPRDANGRRVSIKVENSDFEIECDQVIMAIGTNPNPLLAKSCPRLQTGRGGVLIVNSDLQTSIDRVYAGGDATSGAATVILAMAAGRKAAKSIIERLSI